MKLKPFKSHRILESKDWDLMRVAQSLLEIELFSLADPEISSLTDMEDNSEIDYAPPMESPCGVYTPRPDQELETKISEFTLSEEARYVISLVLDTPAEAVDYLWSPRFRRTTRKKLLSYLSRLGWSPKEVRSVFYELADFVGGLGE